MSIIVIQATASTPFPTPVRIPMPDASAWPDAGLTLEDVATGQRFPAQRDGEQEMICVLGPHVGERRLRLMPSSPGTVAAEVQPMGPHLVEIRLDGELLTRYDFEPQNARPYFYPLLGPGGRAVTRDFPMRQGVPGESSDHPHHRSMWSAYGEVNGTDNWSEGKNHARQVPQGEPERMSGPVFGRLSARNQWVSAEGTPQVDERRSLTCYALGAERRLFDYEISFTANYGDVHFGDTKEGGLLSFRVASSMDGSRQGHIENSAGGRGEKECWGKAAAWCDYSGPVDGEIVGIAVMDHPDNLRSPVHWHVRDYGLMTTNCFGDSTFAGDEGGHRGDYTLKAYQTLTFRYRVLLHRGDAGQGGVTHSFAAYVHPPVVRFE